MKLSDSLSYRKIMQEDLRSTYKLQINQLQKKLKNNNQKFKIKKKTISNLFRYEGRNNNIAQEVDLSDFNKPIFLDKKNKTLEVGGLSTCENVVDYTLSHNLLPYITPELKHITIGGAIVGIGIESNSHIYGFFHNSLVEADVLLPNGTIITCSKNLNHDLFDALANSYGTLGYIIRAKIKLRKALPYMELNTQKFENITSFISVLKQLENNPKIDSLEGLIYSNKELYLTTIVQKSKPINLKSIYGLNIFYKEISQNNKFTLPTKDYIFRYDPEWFWNMPNNLIFKLFRLLAPQKIRNSSFYTRYAKTIEHISFLNSLDSDSEELIQDWEVPIKYAKSLIEFTLDNINLLGKPLMVALIKLPSTPTIYPMKKNELYFNLGSYSFVKKIKRKPAYYTTKIIDNFCFAHEGIKMLYSSTFMTKPEFDKIYNGKAYSKLKKKYDPNNLLPTLYGKAVKNK